MDDNILKFRADLLEAIQKRYDTSEPKYINEDTKMLAIKYSIDLKLADTERKTIENKLRDIWVEENTDTDCIDIQSKYLTILIKNIILELGRNKELLLKKEKVKLKFNFGSDAQYYRNIDVDSLTQMVIKALNSGIKDVNVITNTYKMGLIRSSTILNQIKSGFKYFRYDGNCECLGLNGKPRQFCKNNLGKVYSITDIKKVGDIEGLPFIIYMGGWGCKHRWSPVIENLK